MPQIHLPNSSHDEIHSSKTNDQAASRNAALAQLTSGILNSDTPISKQAQATRINIISNASEVSSDRNSMKFNDVSKALPRIQYKQKSVQLLLKQTELPTLPSILDKSLEELVFTHEAAEGGNAHSNHSYERLEFLGDAYIELIASRLIYLRFPKRAAGKLSQIRESLVKNETLAGYALRYGFDERAHVPREYKNFQSNNKLWTKALGDIFEAYLAAIVLSDPENGFDVAENWLTELWSPKLLNEENDLPLDHEAKSVLARKILGKGIKIDYRSEEAPKQIKREGKIWYTIAVYLTGWGWQNQRLGAGKGLNMKEAGARAASEALTNPLVAKISAIKRDYDAKVKLEKEQQSADISISEPEYEPE